jgi:hypothetical protein
VSALLQPPQGFKRQLRESDEHIISTCEACGQAVIGRIGGGQIKKEIAHADDCPVTRKKPSANK